MPAFRLSRRRLIQAGGVGLVAAPAVLKGLTVEASSQASSLFTLGVMSGDPGDSHVTLWTRLAPDPLNGGGMGSDPVAVRWEVATDPGMYHVIRGGKVLARAETGHAVSVVARGLPSSHWLYYRFQALGERSRIGRTRTFPAPRHARYARYFDRYDDDRFDHRFGGFDDDDDDGGKFAYRGRRRARHGRLRFALTSCQNYQQGFYAAWADIAKQDLDCIVHVGDYIYESGPTSSPIEPDRLHSGGEIFSVEDYRNRYALYRLDQQLQDAQARFPVIHTPDDHEVDNNYAGSVAEEGAPFVEREFLERRRNAYKVLLETMPYGRGVGRRIGRDNIQLYRKLEFGDLASIFVLDTRQFRSDQAAEDGFVSNDPDSALLEPVLGEPLFDPEIDSPDGTLLGGRQERWLRGNLRRSRSKWNVLAQQIMVTEWNLRDTLRANVEFNPAIPPEQKAQILPLFDRVDNFFLADPWDGYRGARERLFKVLDRYRPSNPVVVTGDIHSAWAANLLKDFQDPNSDLLAAEFVCTSISSTFAGIDPRPIDAIVKLGLGINPQIEFFNGLFRGYAICDVNRKRWETTYRSVGTLADAANTADPLALVPRADSPVQDDAVVQIRSGFNKPGSGKRIETTFSQLA